MTTPARTHRAGDSIDDYCRACKALRGHKVIVAGADGAILRVVCGFCGSQHNFRGGGFVEAPLETSSGAARSDDPSGDPGAKPHPARSRSSPATSSSTGWPLVSERERRYAPMGQDAASNPGVDLELLLRRVLREEMGLTAVAPADKWRGGDMVLRPGKPGLQEKSWPIETFFHKIVMLRNRLRVLEQQINSAELSEDLKVRLQGYVTACYGTLTSFNVLFADEADRFQGTGGSE